MAIGAFGVLTLRPGGSSSSPAPAPTAAQGGAGGSDVGNPIGFSARGAIVRAPSGLVDAPSVVQQTAAQLVASSMPTFLPGSQAGAAFGGGAAPSTGPTVVVAATPSTVVPGATPAPGTAAPSVDASQATFGGGTMAPPAAPAGVSSSSSASQPGAVSATAPSSGAAAASSGLTMTEGLAIGAAALAVVGFVLLRKGGKRRR